MKYALVGNPNCGKTSLFNALTGSRAKVANLPGVTVDPIMARLRTKGGMDAAVDLIDLPGTYSLHPKAPDEAVTRDALFDPNHAYRPDGLVVVMDAANLKRNLYLTLQVLDLGLPSVVVVNETAPTSWSKSALEAALGCPVIPVHALNGKGTKALKEMLSEGRIAPSSGGPQPDSAKGWRSRVDLTALEAALPNVSPSGMDLLVTADDTPDWLDAASKITLAAVRSDTGCGAAELQLGEAGHRSRQVREIATQALGQNPPASRSISARIDRLLTHRVAGPLILLGVFFLIFQAVYAWATWPMDLIDAGMGWLMGACRAALPAGWWTDLIVDGLLAGLGGVVIFVPQIALLFGAVAALEESGYMTRVSFMNDRWLRSLGLDGRSAIPLLGGFACAIPAILGARTIPGKRERLLTILITPWMTCSARLPVYLFLIGFVVPSQPWGPGGLLNLQGVFLFCIYAAGLLAGLLLAWILHKGIPKAAPTQFLQEWPPYRVPSLKRTLEQVWMQARGFVEGAGKVIVMVSIILWVLSNTAPGGFESTDATHAARVETLTTSGATPAQLTQAERDWQADRMGASWSGRLGDFIEPVIAPLGYDGRMGVALIASFAAREVFVGTMATLYAAPDSDEGIGQLKARLGKEINPNTGRPVLGAATAMSLIVFYMLAMQCISTIAIVRQELGSWNMAALQALGMTVVAYLAAWLTYAGLS
ncbi:MAG: ferrous iron transport protein B [Flavobacteriales bacterium]|nr:ferrous iron transport protein B [Flavobacteriales bacterium]